MRLLADTHTLLWALLDPRQLSANAAAALRDGSNSVFFSMVSVWEIGIKVGLGKLDISGSLEEFVEEHLRNGVQLLPIRVAHIARIVTLPRHHGDPFDRLLIGQAAQDHLTVVTADPAFASYPVKTLW